MNKKILNILGVMFTFLVLMSPSVTFAVSEATPSPTSTPTPSGSPVPTDSPKPTESPVPPKPVEVTGITLNLEKLSMVEGDDRLLKATITPSNATDSSVTWESDKVKVVTVDKTGKVVAVGEGTATITATSTSNPDVKATCLVTVTPKKVVEVEKSKDATIKSLTLKKGKLSEAFSSTTKKYTLILPDDVKELAKTDFVVTLNHSKASYMITYPDSIRTNAVVRIIVTAEDGSKETYQLIIEKSKKNLNLKSLKIKGYTLNEVFRGDNLEYTVDIPYEAVDITVQAAPEVESFSVEVVGATGLKVGKNIVSVIVEDDDGNTQTYKITVNRAGEDEREKTEGNKYTSPTSKGTSKVVISHYNTPNHTLKYVFVSIGCLVLFAIGGIGFYFYIKTSPKKLIKKDKKSAEPLKEEIKESTVTESAPSVLPGDLDATREFKPDDFELEQRNEEVKETIDDLFKDE